MKRTALAFILAALAPLAFGQADETGAQPVRTPDRSVTCTLDALNETCAIALEGRAGAGAYYTTSALTGNIIGEVSFDGGTTWTDATIMWLGVWEQWGDFSIKTFSSSTETDYASFVLPGGATNARFRMSAFTSGSIVFKMAATTVSGAMRVIDRNEYFVINPMNLDLNSGAGTALLQSMGLAGASTSGAVPIEGTAANGLEVDVTRVTGTVTTDGVIKDGTGDTTQANVSSGRLHVDGSGVTQPVSGTVVTAGPVASANNDGACVSVTASTTVLASFASRKGFSLFARETNTDVVYIKMGGTATSSDFPLPAGSAYNMQAAVVYTGVIDAIAASGTQSVCVVEF